MRLGPVDRSRPVRTQLKGTKSLVPDSWTRDGRLLAYYEISGVAADLAPSPTAHSTIHVFDAPTGVTRPLTGTRFRERDPAFSPDGQWIYAESSRLMCVALQLGATPQAGRRERHFDGRYAWERFGNYDILPDGSFAIIKRAGQVGNAAILRVVLNWPRLVGHLSRLTLAAVN